MHKICKLNKKGMRIDWSDFVLGNGGLIGAGLCQARILGSVLIINQILLFNATAAAASNCFLFPKKQWTKKLATEAAFVQSQNWLKRLFGLSLWGIILFKQKQNNYNCNCLAEFFKIKGYYNYLLNKKWGFKTLSNSVHVCDPIPY